MNKMFVITDKFGRIYWTSANIEWIPKYLMDNPSYFVVEVGV